MSLKGKTVFVIGGSKGIGRATAMAAAAAGAHVYVGSRDEDRVRRAAEAIGHGAQACVLDVRDARGMAQCFLAAERIDHLVVTAAEVHTSPFIEADLDAAHKLMEVKFWGQVRAVHEALPVLDPDGSVTLFTGVAAHAPVPGYAFIAAANGAVEAMMRSLARELSPLRVNAVSPGFVDTHGMDASRRETLAEKLPAGRVGAPEDIAQGVLFLMQNPYVTGTILHIDGGRRLV